MASIQIPNLPAVISLNGTEQFEVVQGGVSSRANTLQLAALFTGIPVPFAISIGGTGAATAAGARTNLGLGTMAVQNASSVAITGGTIQGVAITLDSLDNTPIGANTPSTGVFTTVGLTGTISGTAAKGAISYGTLPYTDTNIFASYAANVNSYDQEIISNANGGTTSSADYVVSNDLGTATTHFGDFGINSSGFTGSSAFNTANAVFLTSTTGDLAIGTTTANAIHFVVNSGATDAATISSAGVFSLGTALAVSSGGIGVATLGANGVLLGNGTSAVTATAVGLNGQVLVGNTGAAPTWSAATGVAVTSLSFGTTGLTPNSATTGAIVVSGTLAVGNGGTGITSFGTGIATALGQNVNGSGSISLTLASNITYYIATTGNDSNNGLTVGTPFLTFGHAFDIIRPLNPNKNTITLQIADGTYAVTTIEPKLVYGDFVQIIGNQTTPGNVILNFNAAAGAHGFLFQHGARIGFIDGVTVNGNGWISHGVWTAGYTGAAFYFNSGGSSGVLGPNIVVNKYYYGGQAFNGATFTINGTGSGNVFTVNEGGDVGLHAFNGGSYVANYPKVNLCADTAQVLGHGFVAEQGGAAEVFTGTATSNAVAGFLARGGTMWAHLGTATGSTYGVWAQKGRIEFNGGTATGNGTGLLSQNSSYILSNGATASSNTFDGANAQNDSQIDIGTGITASSNGGAGVRRNDDSQILNTANISGSGNGLGNLYAGTVQFVGDANVAIASGVRAVVLTATLTTSRTYTLPAASATPSDAQIQFADSAGGLSSANAAIFARAGSDTINGATSVTIAEQYAGAFLVSDFTSKWNYRGLGSAAAAAIGTSGATVPLLNGTNTWSSPQTFTANQLVSTASAPRFNTNNTTATGTAFEDVGGWTATANNGSSASKTWVQIFGQIVSPTNGAETSNLNFGTLQGGTLASRIVISNGLWTINSGGDKGADTINALSYFAGAGTTTVAPIRLASGTNLTTAVAGAFEYDGSVTYFSPAASTRSTIAAEQIMYLGTAYTLTNATGVQKLFNGSTNGQVTLPIGDYQFECYANISALPITGTYGFALAGTATYTQSWVADAQRVAAGTAGASTTSFNTTANTAVTPTSATTTGYMRIRGTINVTVTGTVIPQFSMTTTAAAAVIGVGSYFKISPFNGTNGATNVVIGNWS